MRFSAGNTNIRKISRGLTKAFDETVILGTLLALRFDDHEALEDPRAGFVVEAIKRSTAALGPQASVNEVAEYVRSIGPDQFPGFMANIKGITHELWAAKLENSDRDEFKVELHDAVNHPGSDAYLVAPDGTRMPIQYKVGDRHIAEHFSKYDDIDVYTTDREFAEADHHDSIHYSGVDGKELEDVVRESVEDLSDGHESIASHIPALSLFLTCLKSAPTVYSWAKGKISKEECIKSVAKTAGWKTAKVAAILGALSIPVVGQITSVYLVAKMIYHVYKTYIEG